MSRRPLMLLALASMSAAAAALVWLVALSVPRGRALDASAMEAFTGVARPPLEPSISGMAHLADPTPFVLAGALLVTIAFLRRRPMMAAVTAAILLGANVATQLLKPALAHERVIDVYGVDSVYPASWPSGHATAAMSLALCCVLVVGPLLRPLAALLGAGYAVGVGYALVALGWHLPSDVVGGFLVAATFTLCGAAALAALEARRPELAVRRLPSAAISLPALGGASAALVALAAMAAVVRAPGLTVSALEHPTAIAAGAGIGALGLALTAGLAVALRR